MVEQVERRTTAYMSALITRGAEVNLWTVLEEKRSEFDELLCAEPVKLNTADAEEMELRRILGVA